MIFCQYCSNIMLVDNVGSTGKVVFYCQTCPFIFPIDKDLKYCNKITYQSKQVDDILGGSQMWESLPKENNVKCPSCSNFGAYYKQMQTRSADEPMTNFYKCINVECGDTWKD